MLVDEENTAGLILNRLGGRRALRALLGAREFVDHLGSLSFEYGKECFFRITYAGPFVYDLDIDHNGVEQEFKGVPLDDVRALFENITREREEPKRGELVHLFHQ